MEQEVVQGTLFEDVEVAEKKEEVAAEKPSLPSSFLIVRRFTPETVVKEKDPNTTEGIVIELTPNGRINPASVPEFIMDFKVATMPDGRTVVVAARCRNNYIITESISSLRKEDFNLDEAVEACKARILNKLWDMLQFTWCMGTVTNADIKEEYAASNEVPVNAETGEAL